MKGALNLFEGGAEKVHVYRLGTGGTTGKAELKDTEDAAAVTLETKYPSNIKFAVSLKQKLGSKTKKEFFVYQGAVLKEKFEYEVPAEEDEGQILTDIVNARSAVFHAAKAAEGKNLQQCLSRKSLRERIRRSQMKITAQRWKPLKPINGIFLLRILLIQQSMSS